MTTDTNQSKKKIKQFTVLSSSIIVVSIILHLIFGNFLSWKSYDLFTKFVGGKEQNPHKDVILLLIDENSMRLGEQINLGRWPWKRAIYKEIINFINMVNPPKAIMFDILFPGSSPIPGHDEQFAKAVINSGNIFHNILITQNSENKKGISLPPDVKKHFTIKVEQIKNISFAFNKGNEFTMPIPCLRATVDCSVKNISTEMIDNKTQNDFITLQNAQPAALGLSVASFEADNDGIYRRGRMLFKYKDSYLPSFTLSALMAYTGASKIKILNNNKIQVGNYIIPIDSKGKYLVNYHPKRIPVYSMSGLMKSAALIEKKKADNLPIHPKIFKDKIVIIGVSAVGGKDLKNTPLLKNTPGPEIHANIISNILLNNNIILEPHIATYVIVTLLILLSIAAVFFSHQSIFQFGSIFIIFIGYSAVSVLLFRYANFLTQSIFTLSTVVLSSGVAMGFMRATESAEKRKYSKILSNMVDPSIVKEALNDLESLKKGGEMHITAFFSDIASFSTISEKLTSQELADLLNEYLSAMTIILKKHGGTLDKYIGDAIVGIFGAPIVISNTALAAAKAGLEMTDRLEKLKEKWTQENAYCKEAQQMSHRIGLNTGLAKVGFMGTDELASYTMMGDTVNLAARLEAAGKDYGVHMMISEIVKEQIDSEIHTRILDSIRVKGKSEPVKVYEVMDLKQKASEAMITYTNLYEQAFDLYQQQEWQEAIEIFKQAATTKGNDDPASNMLIERCKFYLENPPGKHWDGVYTRMHK